MNWTNEKPTAPGWYWWRVDHHAPVIMSVVSGPPDDRCQMYAHFRSGNNKTYDGPIVSLGGQFAGPIPSPDDRPANIATSVSLITGEVQEYHFPTAVKAPAQKYKKFILIQHYEYYPAGGLSDIEGSFDTIEEAKAGAEKDPNDYNYIIDRDTWEQVWRSD